MNKKLCYRDTVNYVYKDKDEVLGQPWWAMLPCGKASDKEIEKASCGNATINKMRARKSDRGAVGLKKALGERNANSSGHILISCVCC